ncbi:hypothetical protein I4U23_015094 [Adineta vaga]|nr:hypothetical protein I4U23_015094 [Adineta vaga]
MTLTYLGQQLTIYIGIFLFIIGVIGNGMNVFILSSTATYRKNPSTFCFLLSSITNCLYIIIILTVRILSVGYELDLTSSSIVWCKMRPFLVSVLALISLTCSCMATVDQFLITSKNVLLRQYSNIKRTHRITFGMIIIWCLHGIPFLVYYNIELESKMCLITNPIYRNYIVGYTLILLCVIPVLIVVLFGYCTFRNISQSIVLVEQRADRQVTQMTLIQVLLIMISVIPSGISSAYMSITSDSVKSADRQMKEVFVSNIVALATNIYFVGNFYMFIITSSRFRSIVKHRISCCQRAIQIRPLSTICDQT